MENTAPITADEPSPPEVNSSVVDSEVPATEKKQHPIVAGFQKLTMMRQFGLLMGLAASIALGLGVVLFTQGDTYKPLMNGENLYNTKDVIQLLQKENIEFNMNPSSGVILVKSDDLHKARLAVAGADLSTDETVGFELLDQEQPLGTSQFMENTRYRRALEGELARTIASITQIRTARVHLAIPKRSVFVRDVREPSASVFIELYAGEGLDTDEVVAIRNLVATSIPELSHEKVTLVDQKGRMLSDMESNAEEELTTKQFEYTRRVENLLNQKINSVLSPVIGSDKFHAEVSADIDFTKTEQADEFYNPDLIALRSEQTINEEKTGENEGGIPGALTNQPPGAAEAPEEAGEGAAGANAPPTSSRAEATRNYEVDRTLSYTQHQQGRMRRLTVAVVVDDMAGLDADGNEVGTPWEQEQLDRLTLLVQDAVGFDVARGDSVNIVNSTFMADPSLVDKLEFWEQPWFWDIAKQILGGLFLLILIFGVLRPAIRNLMEKGADEEDEEEEALASLDIDEEAISDDKVTLSGADEYLLPGPSEGFERQLDALRGLIAEDPGRVALVLRKWVMSDD